jgi:hypothetical protein
VQLPVVEDLGGVPAQVRVHPVGLVQQQPGAFGHRRPLAQDVTKGRDPRAWWVRGLARLSQLLRIAQQHQVPGRADHGQDVGQRQLPRLIHEQGVHAGRQAAARPQPGGARGHVQLAVPQCPLQSLGCHGRGRIVQLRVVPVRPLPDPQCQSPSARVHAHSVDQMMDDRVRRPGDASRAALREEREDLLGGGVGLPGARWSLQRQV